MQTKRESTKIKRRSALRRSSSTLPGAWRAGWTWGLLVLALTAACGYKVKGAQQVLPAGIQSLGIPTFRNATHEYRLEQDISKAVLKEFRIRTAVPVSSQSSGVDAILAGEIHNLSSNPVTFGNDTFGSAFLVTVRMNVKLVRLSDGAVLWENSDYMFRERYVINRDVTDFFSERSPAIDRLAKDFASSLASTVLNQ